MKISNLALGLGTLYLICTIPAAPRPLPQAPASSATASPQAFAAGVSRTTRAINYGRPGSSTKIAFGATDLMKGASGDAKVDNKSNHIEIEVHFAGLDDASKFGLEYLTYVLWAVSPQGRAENLGEVIPKSSVASLKGATNMQTFGMILTAEPYFAVSQPGNMVVLENSSPSAEGVAKVENITATYELVGRGEYSSSNTRIEGAIFGIDRNTPLQLFEARNAVRVARNAQADKYAAPVLAKAEQELGGAEEAYRRKRDRKLIEASAREAVETAEEARVMAAKQKADEDAQAHIAADKKAAELREAQARAEAEAEARRREEAEQARVQAEQAKAEAERMKQEADAARQQALAQQEQAEREAKAAAAAKAAAEAEAQKAREAQARAEAEKAQLRAQLLQQLNAVLQTQDSARGLIVNMSDVLFDTGSFTLKPGAREKLAKISGILVAHPGLTLAIEGHTDSVGGDDFNQQLSGRRADSVRDFLAEQGVAPSSMTAQGFGKTQPVASNDTPEGRQRNRRVELVVNGDAIGNAASASTGNPGANGSNSSASPGLTPVSSSAK